MPMMATVPVSAPPRRAARAPAERRIDGPGRADPDSRSASNATVGVAEELRDRHLVAALPQLGVNAQQADRMPPQVEEVVVNTHALDAQHLTPQVRERRLDRRARGHVLRPQVARPGRLRERRAIELAVGSQRQ